MILTNDIFDKMRIVRHIFLLNLLLLFTGTFYVKAQVTIGSSTPPKTGALLDLKQNDQQGFNSNLGMLLPRVYVKQKGQLLPMLDDMQDYPTNATVKSNQDLLHTGLLVFNLNKCLMNTGSDQGIVVWDGSKWTSLSEDQTISTNVVTNVDQDGNKFYSRLFGNAGESMLQNIKVKTYNDGTSIGTENTDWVSPSIYGDAPSTAGYLYTKNIALRKTDTELSSTYNAGNVVGICPPDWRIPTDADWTSLEKEINTHTSLYSSMSDIGNWQTDWESAFGSRGGFGDAMKAICLLVYKDPQNNIDGLSFQSSQGGFDVILSGFDNDSYGEEAKYWTTTVSGSPNIVTRLF